MNKICTSALTNFNFLGVLISIIYDGALCGSSQQQIPHHLHIVHYIYIQILGINVSDGWLVIDKTGPCPDRPTLNVTDIH